VEAKTFEVRDAATFIPVVGVLLEADPNGGAAYLLRRSGFHVSFSVIGPKPKVMLTRLQGGSAFSDPVSWGVDSTLCVAHLYIQQYWSILRCGQVVDVEWIKGLTRDPRISERFGK
jgi:hypothetical protein